MSWYYEYYIGIQNKETKKIDVFAPFDALGKIHSVVCKSRSFASDLYQDFYPAGNLLTEKAMKLLWNCTSSDEEEYAFATNYTSYLPLNELSNSDYLKKGYFLLEDILAYEENNDNFDGFYEYLTPTAFNFKLQSELKYGVPSKKKDIDGYEIPVYSCADYGYYIYPDYQSKEYESSMIKDAVEMIVPYGLPDTLRDYEIVIICTQG